MKTVVSLQKVVNDHCMWLSQIFNVGSNWDHNDRIRQSMNDKGEVVAPLYLLIKDHKGWSEEGNCPPPPAPCAAEIKGTTDT